MDETEAEQTDPRWDLIDEGMLSPVLEEWRSIYMENHADWFELARKTNRHAVWLSNGSQSGPSMGAEKDPLFVALRGGEARSHA